MKITIDIPQEFEKHFNEDRFEDSLKNLARNPIDFRRWVVHWELRTQQLQMGNTKRTT